VSLLGTFEHNNILALDRFPRDASLE